MSTVDFTPIICVVSLIALTLWGLRQAKVYHEVKGPGRTDERIPADEMRLVGEDYRDHVAPYFRKVSKRREIVRDITGAS